MRFDTIRYDAGDGASGFSAVACAWAQVTVDCCCIWGEIPLHAPRLVNKHSVRGAGALTEPRYLLQSPLRGSDPPLRPTK